MGCWGVEAYSNDHTYDCLPVNLNTMTQEQCDKAINKSASRRVSPGVGHDYKEEAFLGVVIWVLTEEAFLGVVIWVLTCGKKVDKDDLRQALSIARHFRVSGDYIKCYAEPEAKKYALEREIKAMEYALEHDGVAELEKGKGLLENILFRKPLAKSKRDTILEQMQSVVAGNLLVTFDMIKEWRDFVNNPS